MSTYTPFVIKNDLKEKTQRSKCPECYPHVTLSDGADVIPNVSRIPYVFYVKNN